MLLAAPQNALIHREERRSIRFLSLIGNEGSGHHSLTPAIHQILGFSGGHDEHTGFSRHMPRRAFTEIGEDEDSNEAAEVYMFNGDETGELFHAYRERKQRKFSAALGRFKQGSLIQQEYSFPTSHWRKPSTDFYDITGLYQMLHKGGVDKKVVIKYQRDLDSRAHSIFRRSGYFGGNFARAKFSESQFERLIERHLHNLDHMRVPMIRVSMNELNHTCPIFVQRVTQFLMNHEIMPRQQNRSHIVHKVCNGHR